MWRARDSIRAMVCSATAMVLLVGALTTTMPRRVAASRSMLSTPVPARPTTSNRVPAASTSAVTSGGAAHDQRVIVADHAPAARAGVGLEPAR